MADYSIEEAQVHLRELIHDAQLGKQIQILDENGHAVQLVVKAATAIGKPRKAGSAKGLVKMAPDFDAPLDDFKDYME